MAEETATLAGYVAGLTFEEIPPEVLNNLRFVPVERMDEVINVALHALPLSQDEMDTLEPLLRPIKPIRVRRAPAARPMPRVSN